MTDAIMYSAILRQNHGSSIIIDKDTAEYMADFIERQDKVIKQLDTEPTMKQLNQGLITCKEAFEQWKENEPDEGDLVIFISRLYSAMAKITS